MTLYHIVLNPQYITLAATIVSCITTVALAFFTSSYVKLTRKMVLEATLAREEAARPTIMVSIQARDDEPNWIDLIIKNIGRGCAYNIRFKLEPDFTISIKHHGGEPLRLSNVGFIEKGIPSFAPEQRLQFFLTNLLGTLEQKAREPIGIIVNYEDVAGKHYTDRYVLDFGLFRNMAYVGKPAMETIADSLQNIQKAVHSLTRGTSIVSVRLTDRKKKHSQHPEILLPPGVSSDDEHIGSFD